MINTSILFIYVAIFTINLQACTAKDVWIDPYDMSISKEYSLFSENKATDDNAKSLAEAYFKRAINMLLNSVHEEIIDERTYTGHLFIKIDVEKYKILKNFADGVTNDLDLNEIDRILAEMLNKPTHEHLQEYLETWFHKFLNILLSREGIITITIVSFNFVIYKQICANFNLMIILKFLFINFFLFDFIFTWIYLYQLEKAKEITNMIKLENVPTECHPNNMNTWTFLLNLLSYEDKCEQFYKLQFQDIFFKVTPGVVLSEMFARTIKYPAKAIGTAFGDVCYGIYSAFPWPLNIFILPILLVFFGLMTFIIISLILSKPISINIFHLLKFSFGGETNSRSQNQDAISGDNLKTLLQLSRELSTNSRQFVEVIPIEKSNKEKMKIKSKASDEKTKNKTKKSIEDKKVESSKSMKKSEEKTEVGGGDCK